MLHLGSKGLAAIFVLGVLGCETRTSVSPIATATETLRGIRERFPAARTLLGAPRLNRAVSLPALASGVVRVSDPVSGMTLHFGLAGTRDVPRGEAAGVSVYDGALGGGTALLHRVNGEGTEDLVLFESPPAVEKLIYQLQLDRSVSGLRAVGGAIEFLDAAGVPRLRVARPWTIDAAGERRVARLWIEGCTADRDPRGPWGRPTVSPGADRCTLVLDFASEDTVYPLLVDPSWTTTQQMMEARTDFISVTLASNGKVLAAGGSSADSPQDITALDSAELYNPTSGTWAVTDTMKAPRARPAFAALANGITVLAAGGARSGSLSGVGNPAYSLITSESYSATTAVWRSRGLMSYPRVFAEMVALDDGSAMIAAGKPDNFSSPSTSAGVDHFDPLSGSWTGIASLNVGRYGTFVMAKLDAGRVLVAGGFAAGGITQTLSEAETYEPQASSWLAASDLLSSRATRLFATLPGNDILVTGGSSKPTATSAFTATRATEIYRNQFGVWERVGNLHGQPTASYRNGAIGALNSGELVVALGLGASGPIYERYQPLTGVWLPACDTNGVGLSDPGLARLMDGRLLFIGGALDTTGTATRAAWLHAVSGQCGCDQQCPDPGTPFCDLVSGACRARIDAGVPDLGFPDAQPEADAEADAGGNGDATAQLDAAPVQDGAAAADALVGPDAGFRPDAAAHPDGALADAGDDSGGGCNCSTSPSGSSATGSFAELLSLVGLIFIGRRTRSKRGNR